MDGKRRVALVLLIATLGALGVSTVLEQAFDRPRPDLMPYALIVYTASFPSGHSMLAGWTAGTGWALLCWLLARWMKLHVQ